MTKRRPPRSAVLAAVSIAVISAATIAYGLNDGSPSGQSGSSGKQGAAAVGSASPSSTSSPPAQKASGPVVNVSLTDSGGPMGEGTGPMQPGAMGLKSDLATVPHGTVTFRVTNTGAVNHEMVILPLAPSQAVGTRPFDGEAKIDEAGNLGEASRSGGVGKGEGIEPGASGQMSVTLVPGQYELVCNYMGHYVSGMYGKLTVT